MGTARWEKEAEVRNEEVRRRARRERARRDVELAETEVSARIAVLQRELEARRSELEVLEQEDTSHEQGVGSAHEAMLRLRGGVRDLEATHQSSDTTRPSSKRSK